MNLGVKAMRGLSLVCACVCVLTVRSSLQGIRSDQLLEMMGMPADVAAALESVELSQLTQLTDTALRYDFGLEDEGLRRRLLVGFGAAPPDSRELGQQVVVAVTSEGSILGIDGMTGVALWNRTLPEPLVQSSRDDAPLNGPRLIPSLDQSKPQIYSFADGSLRNVELQKHHQISEGKSLSLARDAHMIVRDSQPVQLLAIDPSTGEEPASTTAPSLLLALQRQSAQLLEPTVWSVRWNASWSKVSAAVPNQPQQELTIGRPLAPVLMTTAASGVLVALHPLSKYCTPHQSMYIRETCCLFQLRNLSGGGVSMLPPWLSCVTASVSDRCKQASSSSEIWSAALLYPLALSL